TFRTRDVQLSGPSCTGFFPKFGQHATFPRVGLLPPFFFFLSQKTSDPAEFRPIALTNTMGKIFFSVFSKRLEKYMLANKFTSHAQKGFKTNTPGCLEHCLKPSEMPNKTRDKSLSLGSTSAMLTDRSNTILCSLHCNGITFQHLFRT